MIAVAFFNAPLRATRSKYPAPFASLVAGRFKRARGNHANFLNFEATWAALVAGARSAPCRSRSVQNEFDCVVVGDADIVSRRNDTIMEFGLFAGFRGGGQTPHLENRFDEPLIYPEIGDCTAEGWTTIRKEGVPNP